MSQSVQPSGVMLAAPGGDWVVDVIRLSLPGTGRARTWLRIRGAPTLERLRDISEGPSVPNRPDHDLPVQAGQVNAAGNHPAERDEQAMTRQIRPKGELRAEPEEPLMINLKITLPRRVIWPSGFLSGSVASDTISHLIRVIHGG